MNKGIAVTHISTNINLTLKDVVTDPTLFVFTEKEREKGMVRRSKVSRPNLCVLTIIVLTKERFNEERDTPE